MKKRTSAYLIFGCIFLAACSDDDATVVKEEIVLPSKVESIDSKVEFTHDDSHKISTVKSSYYYPNDVVLETNYTYAYTSDGKFKQCVTDNGFRFDYTYDGDRLVRTDEYINDIFTQYHSFVYNGAGRMTERTTWQNIPEEGGWIPVSKEELTYDAHENLLTQKLFFYNTGTQQHKLLTSFSYENYDDGFSVEGLFANYIVNPEMKLSKNNPRKVTTTNGNGITSFISEFSYSYDDVGYPLSRSIKATVVSSGEVTTSSQTYSYVKHH